MTERQTEPTFAEQVAALPWEGGPAPQDVEPTVTLDMSVTCLDCSKPMHALETAEFSEVPRFRCSGCHRAVQVELR